MRFINKKKDKKKKKSFIEDDIIGKQSERN
jgi:hypothetical protein